MKSAKMGFCLLGVVVVGWAGCQSLSRQEASNDEAYRAEIREYRQERDRKFRTSPFSQLALVHREYLEENFTRLTIGRGPEADLQLAEEGIASVHAVIEEGERTLRLRPLGGGVVWSLGDPPTRILELPLEHNTGFRIGRFNLRYIVHGSWGPTVEVYDSQHPALVEFTGMDYFPVDAAYRVEGEILPYEEPEQLELIDSQGNKRPYWLYGELRFQLQGTACQLEVYAPSLDPAEIEEGGFMLMFTDATSGEESYPAARYLYVEGKAAGRITVDFNKAFSPPCNYSSVFTCPFPRPQNRLPVSVRAGQKWYRKKPGAPAGGS